jgi:hypothetical protein
MFTYDPKEVSASFNGLDITGYAEGTFINAEPAEDAFTKVVGSDGKATRTANPDRSGRITLTLKQSSPINGFLSIMANADKVKKNVVGPFIIKDNSGSGLVMCSNAWIAKEPSMTFGKDAENRDWIFDCEDMTIPSAGGNTEA